MKKRIKTRKFSRSSNERKQMFRNLIGSLSEYGFIITSEAKAKAIKPQAEKMVTMAKINSLTTMRRLVSAVGSVEVAKRLLAFGSLFKNRQGGYLRIIRLSVQSGDDSRQVRLEWVEQLAKSEVVVKEKKAVAAPVEVQAETKETVESQTPVKKETKPKRAVVSKSPAKKAAVTKKSKTKKTV